MTDTTPNPALHWTKISEERVYNGYRKIKRILYQFPDGVQEYYDVYEDAPVASVFMLTADNQVVLVKQFRPGPGKVLTGLAGGFIDEGETAAEAIAREMLEETGYKGDLQLLAYTHQSGYSTAYPAYFIALNCKKVQEPQPEHNEFFEVILMELGEFRLSLSKGEITHGLLAYMALDHLKLL